MIFHFTLYALLILISGLISGGLALYVWRRRAAPGGLYFALLMAATSEWALFNFVSLAASGTWLDNAAYAILYVGVVAVAPLWLLFTLEYSKWSGWLTPRRRVLLWIIPAASLVLVATNAWHGLVWPQINAVSDAFGPRLIYEHGIVDWVLMAYSYTLMLVGSIVLIATAAQTIRPYRSQIWTLLLGTSVSWLGSIVYFTDATSFRGIDFTPLTLSATGLIFTWGIFRQGLFDLKPVAEETLITSMADGVLVLDSQHRVADINPVARKLICTTGRVVGLPAEAVTTIWPELESYCRDRQKKSVEIRLATPEEARWLHVNIAPLEDREGCSNGMLIVLRDVTDRRHAAAALQRAYDDLRQANEALQDEISERKRAEAQILASLTEKEVLLKEIHHRVKNNLQVISSLLSLQAGNLTPECAAAFRESQNRIKSMALIHEKLYRSENLARVDFAEYVSSLTAYLARSYPSRAGVTVSVDIRDITLDIDTAIPCGLIINELVSNSLKYAFPEGRPGELGVSLTREGGGYRLVVSDDGAGLPPGFDFRNPPSLGLQLVNTLVDQIDGTVELENAEGTTIVIRFGRGAAISGRSEDKLTGLRGAG